VISLARKYRPKRFRDLLVQDHVAAALSGAVAKGRVGHGYLLTGPRGVGKTTAARILAMALNCERRTPGSTSGEPCGECGTCERIWSGGANLDVVEIDAASNRSVDDARDLRERAMYAASQERHFKVYIVDEAHMLTREAWNALLKILEEPPPRVIFVFATTEPHKIANTAAPVLSRLQRFDFRRIGAAAIRERLGQVLALEGLTADADAVALIARYADGGMRDALSVLDQCLSLAEGPLTAESVRRTLGLIGDEAYADVLRAVAAKDMGPLFPAIDALVAAGADLVEFMNGLAELLRALLMSHAGAEAEGLTAPMRQVVAEARTRLSAGDALRMLALLTSAETAIRRSANPRLVVETLLLRWAVMDRTVDLEDVLRGSGSGGAGPSAECRVPSAEPVPLTVEGLRGAWPDVAAQARQQGPLVGTLFDVLVPREVSESTVTLEISEGHDHMAEGARRQRPAIESVLARALGRSIRVALAAPPGAEPRGVRPKLLSSKDLQDERLRELRGLDPALDAAADALDLEILE
jgi:DNA polymerase-3 subunit gamma/tau